MRYGNWTSAIGRRIQRRHVLRCGLTGAIRQGNFDRSLGVHNCSWKQCSDCAILALRRAEQTRDRRGNEQWKVLEG